MSPTSYRTAPSRANIIFDYLIILPFSSLQCQYFFKEN